MSDERTTIKCLECGGRGWFNIAIKPATCKIPEADRADCEACAGSGHQTAAQNNAELAEGLRALGVEEWGFEYRICSLAQHQPCEEPKSACNNCAHGTRASGLFESPDAWGGTDVALRALKAWVGKFDDMRNVQIQKDTGTGGPDGEESDEWWVILWDKDVLIESHYNPELRHAIVSALIAAMREGEK